MINNFVSSNSGTGITLSAVQNSLLENNSVILISRVSRLGRNINQVTKILKKIEKKNSYVIAVDESICYNMSKVMNNDFMVKVIESEKESNIQSESIKKTQSYIKKQGGYIGNPPYGYAICKNYKKIPMLVENQNEINVINNIIDLVNNNYSYNDIAINLNTNKILYRNNKWTTNSVKNILDKFYPEHLEIQFNPILSSNLNVNIISDNQEDDDDTESYDMMVDVQFTVLRSGKCIYK